MADVTVKRLDDIQLEAWFEERVRDSAEKLRARYTPYQPHAWRDGSVGPAWASSRWGGLVVFGFKYQASGEWLFETSCSMCRCDGCEHVLALGRVITMEQSTALEQWQRRADWGQRAQT